MHKASRARVRVRAGSNPGSSWCLLPLRRDPDPPRPKGKSHGPTVPEPARLSLTPGRLSGLRGQG